jgi:hypothetical protein
MAAPRAAQHSQPRLPSSFAVALSSPQRAVILNHQFLRAFALQLPVRQTRGVSHFAWESFNWREMLNVLGERKRKRKLQLIPDAVVEWLRGNPILASA